jgi:hypothetical protein
LKPTQSKLALRLGAKHHLTKSADSVVEALEDFEGLYASAELRTEENKDETRGRSTLDNELRLCGRPS